MKWLPSILGLLIGIAVLAPIVRELVFDRRSLGTLALSVFALVLCTVAIVGVAIGLLLLI